jgi:hypothetical protein
MPVQRFCIELVRYPLGVVCPERCVLKYSIREIFSERNEEISTSAKAVAPWVPR